MKSMSMVDQGSASLNCVCKCSKGLLKERSPAIHMRAGEKVCIQQIRPTQLAELLASWHKRRIESESVITGLQATCTGITGDSCIPLAMAAAWSCTLVKVSG